MTRYYYHGPGNRSYPGHLNPETGAVLQGEHPWNDPEEDGDRVPFYNEPGDPIEFGDASPPADGFWYDTVSGQPYTGPPSVEAAGEEPEGKAPGGTGPGQDEEE